MKKMKKIIQKCIRVLFFSVLFCITSCATQNGYKKIYTVNDAQKSVFIDSKSEILVISPKVIFGSVLTDGGEGLQKGVEIDKIKYDIENKALTILKSKGFKLKNSNQSLSELGDIQNELKNIQDNSHLMFKAFI